MALTLRCGALELSLDRPRVMSLYVHTSNPAAVAPDQNAVLRGLARERKLGDIGSQPPFRLTRFVNGQITLTDTSTGKQIDLDAFGSANTEAFARLMKLRGGAA